MRLLVKHSRKPGTVRSRNKSGARTWCRERRRVQSSLLKRPFLHDLSFTGGHTLVTSQPWPRFVLCQIPAVPCLLWHTAGAVRYPVVTANKGPCCLPVCTQPASLSLIINCDVFIVEKLINCWYMDVLHTPCLPCTCVCVRGSLWFISLVCLYLSLIFPSRSVPPRLCVCVCVFCFYL